MAIKKEYTAIYSTEAIKGIRYTFKSENIDNAIAYSKTKFVEYPNIAIIDNSCMPNDFPANVGRLVFLNGVVIDSVDWGPSSLL